MMRRTTLALGRPLGLMIGALAGLGALLPSAAMAQDPAPPARAAQFTAAAADPHEEDDVRLQLNAGANLAYGNARSLGLTLGANFAVREGQHSLVAEAAWTYGAASTRVDPMGEAGAPNYEFGEFAPNANNFNGRLRYDFFASPDDSVWFELRVRADPFAFLEPQLSVQGGYQRVFLREENHRLWMEIGVDYSYQNFGTPQPADVMGVSPALQLADRSIIAYKLLLGYTNEINSGLTYNTRFEVLGGLGQTVPTPEVDGANADFASVPAHLRMQWVNQFRSKIEDWLQLSLDITGRLDSLPVGQTDPWEERGNQPAQMFDLLTTLNLVGTFDLDGEEEEEEAEEAAEEAAEPECPACPEATPCSEDSPDTEADASSDTEAEASSDTEAGSEEPTEAPPQGDGAE